MHDPAFWVEAATKAGAHDAGLAVGVAAAVVFAAALVLLMWQRSSRKKVAAASEFTATPVGNCCMRDADRDATQQ